MLCCLRFFEVKEFIEVKGVKAKCFAVCVFFEVKEFIEVKGVKAKCFADCVFFEV